MAKKKSTVWRKDWQILTVRREINLTVFSYYRNGKKWTVSCTIAKFYSFTFFHWGLPNRASQHEGAGNQLTFLIYFASFRFMQKLKSLHSWSGSVKWLVKNWSCVEKNTTKFSICVLTAVQCPALPAIANGNIYPSTCTTTGVSYTHLCTYSCRSGYQLSGLGSRQCLKDKTWSGVAPTCILSKQ